MEFKERKDRIVLVDGTKEIGEIHWSPANDHLLIADHTFVDPTYRGQGLADQLLEKLVAKARRDDQKIMPMCPFVKKSFYDDPKTYKDVWDTEHNI